ncbi:MAG: hypothetical protein OK438_01505 [Thaumarchaeota archaeon]|nr:hypothetical protein [Nitrososphaerota archaeon]
MEPPGDESGEGPRFTRRSPLRPVRRLCPRCLSPLESGSELGGWLVPQDYYCPKCGYRGTVFIEEGIQKPGKEPGS